MFYAEFCPYGNVAYSSFCGGAYTFYAFETKAERDKYVNINEYDVTGCNLTASAISAKQMRYLAGRNFRLEKSFSIPGAYTVEFDRDRLNPMSAKCVLHF